MPRRPARSVPDVLIPRGGPVQRSARGRVRQSKAQLVQPGCAIVQEGEADTAGGTQAVRQAVFEEGAGGGKDGGEDASVVLQGVQEDHLRRHHRDRGGHPPLPRRQCRRRPHLPPGLRLRRGELRGRARDARCGREHSLDNVTSSGGDIHHYSGVPEGAGGEAEEEERGIVLKRRPPRRARSSWPPVRTDVRHGQPPPVLFPGVDQLQPG
mmetsp:Transcript_41412/g.88244  ORF Transcript_41412/g.88244 Transcript_41412/m.88244 type:complete len:210 (-) Transcript_41412:55-684(-)